MRYVAPARDAFDRGVLASPPLSHWSAFDAMLRDEAWPDVERLNDLLPDEAGMRFVAQDRELLADGLHTKNASPVTGASPRAPATGTTCSTRSSGLDTAP